MIVKGKHYRTVWMEGNTVKLIEQNKLPFHFSIVDCPTYLDTCHAIETMIVRGAGAIGATAGYAMAQAIEETLGKADEVEKAKNRIEATRPTAQNLFYATNRVYKAAYGDTFSLEKAKKEAQNIADEDAAGCKAIGKFGNEVITKGMRIATHCNAGWLAFVDYGSALSPMYEAFNTGKEIHVMVDETRPRSQGARLTAWELYNQGVDHTIIPDNATAWLMKQGKIDLMITGADRIAANGDTANKIGTLEKAIAAKRYGVPFYIAAPTSTIDLDCPSGNEIPIEERSEDEVHLAEGPDKNDEMHTIRITSPGSHAMNPAFDVTDAELITGIITEKGIVEASEEGIRSLF